MTYGGLDAAHDASVPHLGGNIKIGDPFTYSPNVWDYLITRFSISSVLDLGSGGGFAAKYFHAKGLMVVAVDGYMENICVSLYPAILHDLTRDKITTKVDLVHCQEVVEHIEEKYIDNLMTSLLCGKITAITHALPGQKGHHHVNCQSSEYWIKQFEDRGAALLVEDTRRVRELAGKDGARYMHETGLVFVNNNRL